LPVKAFEVLLKKIHMKKILPALLFLTISLNQLFAQADTMLSKRLNQILAYTQEKNTSKILDYTYPKLFTIVTRSMMTEALNGMYDTEEFTTTMDSLFAINIHPVFIVEGKEYCKIVHNMIMRMNFKEPTDTTGEESEADFLLALMGEKYGKENVRFDKMNNSLVIKFTPDMIAVKENNTWYFANYDDENPAMLDLLFSKAVQKKYKEFQ
jgi:hypothetical protein